MWQSKDKRSETHHCDAPSDPTGLGSTQAATKVGYGYQTKERGYVVPAGYQTCLRRSQAEPSLDRGDDDVDETIDDQS